MENVLVATGIRSPLKTSAVPVEERDAPPIWTEPVPTYRSFHIVSVEPSE